MSWWSVAFQALGSAFSGDDDDDGKDNRAATQRLEEMRLAQQRNLMTAARQYDLEDRRYREEAVNRYSGRGGFGPREAAPVFTNTAPSPVALPQAVQPPQQQGRGRNRKPPPQQGLMYFT